MEMITFTPPMRDELRKAYDKAVEHGSLTFEFNGNEYVVGYAKYLLEHLDATLVSVH